MYLLNKFVNKYIIKGIIVTNEQLHIGGGDTEFSPTSIDNAVVKDENNNPYIPGSSLKGVIRSYLERILESGAFEVKDRRLRSCYILEKPCISKERIKEIKSEFEGDDEKIAEVIYNQECDVCRLFGSKWFASKVKMSDAKISKDNKGYLSKKNGVAIDRDTLTAKNGAKYDYEVVGSGTKFDFEMTVENLDEDHTDIIKIILTLLRDGELKVGGKTSVGLGGIELKHYKVFKIDKNNMSDYFLNGLDGEMEVEL